VANIESRFPSMNFKPIKIRVASDMSVRKTTAENMSNVYIATEDMPSCEEAAISLEETLKQSLTVERHIMDIDITTPRELSREFRASLEKCPSDLKR
jgi:hypothetical protein